MFPSKSDGMFVPESLIFRSDSNGEDLEGYAGAGLYDSITMDQTKLKKVDYNGDRYGIYLHPVKAASCQSYILSKLHFGRITRSPCLQPPFEKECAKCWPTVTIVMMSANSTDDVCHDSALLCIRQGPVDVLAG